MFRKRIIRLRRERVQIVQGRKAGRPRSGEDREYIKKYYLVMMRLCGTPVSMPNTMVKT